MIEEASITELLNAWAAGDRTAFDRLVEIVYPELHESARRAMAGERESHTLQPTALVNEVYLRLQGLKNFSWESRRPFFAFAAQLMRRILVEHARAGGAKKRGGEVEHVSIDTAILARPEPVIDPLVLEEALQKLEEVDPRLVRLVELRVFAGLNEQETGAVLELSRATVQRQWSLAKRVLASILGDSATEERP